MKKFIILFIGLSLTAAEKKSKFFASPGSASTSSEVSEAPSSRVSSGECPSAEAPFAISAFGSPGRFGGDFGEFDPGLPPRPPVFPGGIFRYGGQVPLPPPPPLIHRRTPSLGSGNGPTSGESGESEIVEPGDPYRYQQLMRRLEAGRISPASALRTAMQKTPQRLLQAPEERMEASAAIAREIQTSDPAKRFYGEPSIAAPLKRYLPILINWPHIKGRHFFSNQCDLLRRSVKKDYLENKQTGVIVAGIREDEKAAAGIEGAAAADEEAAAGAPAAEEGEAKTIFPLIMQEEDLIKRLESSLSNPLLAAEGFRRGNQALIKFNDFYIEAYYREGGKIISSVFPIFHMAEFTTADVSPLTVEKREKDGTTQESTVLIRKLDVVNFLEDVFDKDESLFGQLVKYCNTEKVVFDISSLINKIQSDFIVPKGVYAKVSMKDLARDLKDEVISYCFDVKRFQVLGVPAAG